MKPKVRIANDWVHVRYGALRLDFPDTPAHWEALWRAWHAVNQELGGGPPGQEGG